MTGAAYAASAELAAELGAFPRFAENREAMLRVIRNHRRAAHGEASGYEGLSVPPVPLDDAGLPRRAAARRRAPPGTGRWRLGEAHGFRNAQVDGDRADRHDRPGDGLRHHRHRAGLRAGQVQEAGRRRLLQDHQPARCRWRCAARLRRRRDRGDHRLRRRPRHARGRRRSATPALRAKGFTDEAIAAVEQALADAFDIRFVFNKRGRSASASASRPSASTPSGWTSPASTCSRPSASPQGEIEAANVHVCGAMTVEGAPGLKAEHLPVFDCANRLRADRQPHLSVESHIRMMAAAQPFISGAISKTINMPHAATVEDVKRGLHAGLAARPEGERALPRRLEARRSRCRRRSSTTRRTMETADIEALVEQPAAIAERCWPSASSSGSWRGWSAASLPNRRKGYTQKARVGGHKVYLRTGEYEDGRLGEIFIDMHKEGAAFRSLMNNFAIAISIALQYGVPLEECLHTRRISVQRRWARRREPGRSLPSASLCHEPRPKGFTRGRSDSLTLLPPGRLADARPPRAFRARPCTRCGGPTRRRQPEPGVADFEHADTWSRPSSSTASVSSSPPRGTARRQRERGGAVCRRAPGGGADEGIRGRSASRVREFLR